MVFLSIECVMMRESNFSTPNAVNPDGNGGIAVQRQPWTNEGRTANVLLKTKECEDV